MKTFRAEELTKSYGEKTLFKGLDFTINEKDRIGLVGINGSGKTSLLNVISGVDSYDKGILEKSKSYSIGYLKQAPDLPKDKTIKEAIFSGKQTVYKTIRHYEAILARYSQNPEDQKLQNEYMQAEAQMNKEDAWNADSEVKTILTQLNINDLNQKISELSGGQVKRVGLAQVLIQSPDLLILDEPTNHLDFSSIEWLEQFLAKYKGSLLLVTHDRYFLDHVVNKIWELSFGKLYKYDGNYQDYVEQKANRVEEQGQAEHKQQQLYKQELKWMKKGAKARSTKQNARVERFNDLEKEVKKGQQYDTDVDISLGSKRLGKKVIELKDANLDIDGKTILNDFNLLIQNGERLGITGENGAGKSSLLNVIAGKLPLQSGTVDIGETVKIGYYTQQTEPIPGEKRVITYLTDVAKTVEDKDGNKISVTNLLEQFLFPKSMHGTLIRKLSGGEKRRLYLLKLLMEQPNVLLLDEPSNNLDISTLTVLEDYIKHFSGTTITVSHDRYFLDKVADQLLIFDGNGKIERFNGEFTDYLEDIKERDKVKSNVQTDVKETVNSDQKKVSSEKTKLTYAEKIEWDKIDKKIDAIFQQIDQIKDKMNNNGSDYSKLSELQTELDEANQKADELTQRWDYLSKYAEE